MRPLTVDEPMPDGVLDLLITGAGPVGLAAALFESLVQQVESVSVPVHLAVGATERRSVAPGFEIALDDDPPLMATTVLVTAGIGRFDPRRLEPLHDLWERRGLTYSLLDPEQCEGKEVLIIGGGDTAVDWAVITASSAHSVTIVHRRPEFGAHQTSVETIRSVGVQTPTPCVLGDVSGVESVTSATPQTLDEDLQITLGCDLLIGDLGFIADLGAISDWGMALKNRRIPVSSTIESSLPGVFAAGDCAAYEGQVPLIASGLGEAVTAVSNAALRCDPTTSIFPSHSPDRDLASVRR